MAIFRSIQPQHRLEFTLFSTSELCGTDGGNKSTSFLAKGVVESLFNLFIFFQRLSCVRSARVLFTFLR